MILDPLSAPTNPNKTFSTSSEGAPKIFRTSAAAITASGSAERFWRNCELKVSNETSLDGESLERASSNKDLTGSEGALSSGSLEAKVKSQGYCLGQGKGSWDNDEPRSFKSTTLTCTSGCSGSNFFALSSAPTACKSFPAQSMLSVTPNTTQNSSSERTSADSNVIRRQPSLDVVGSERREGLQKLRSLVEYIRGSDELQPVWILVFGRRRLQAFIFVRLLLLGRCCVVRVKSGYRYYIILFFPPG